MTERIKVFLLNIPLTLKETFSWLVISYLIPIINIGIIWGIKQDDFRISIDILSIVLVTNACFFTSLFYLAYSTKKERKFLNTITIAAYVITVTFFVVSIIELSAIEKLFPLELYKTGALVTLLAAIFLGLISKYDEVEAMSKLRAEKSKTKKSTSVGNKDVEL